MKAERIKRPVEVQHLTDADALRNAAMRFGAALDLWHKGDLHADEPTEVKADAPSAVECVDPAKELMLEDKMREAGVDQVKFLARAGVKRARDLPAEKFPAAMKALSDILAKKQPAPPRKPAGEFSEIGDDCVPY